MSIRDRFPSRRPLAGVVLLSSLVLLLAMLPSCGPSGDGGDDSSTGSVDAVRDDARTAMEAAREAGADKVFAADFEKQEEKLERAQELLDQGDDGKATTAFKLVARSFDRLERKASEVSSLRQTALAAQKAADEAEKAAKTAKADVDAPREFKEAKTIYDQAVAGLASTDANKLKAAERSFKRAAQFFEETVEFANSNRVVKEKATLEREAMLNQKANAKEAKAEEFAAQDWLLAGQYERSAEADLNGGNFQQAYTNFKLAAQTYAGAIGQARAMQAVATAPQTGRSGFDAGVPTAPEPETVGSSGADDSGTPQPAADTSTPEVGVVPQPEFSDVESFLMANYSKLAAGIRSYDPTTGQVVIEYTDAQLFKSDLVYPVPHNPQHVKFEDPLLAGFADLGTPKAQEEEVLPFVFHGNTRGYILIPVPLKGPMTFDYLFDLDRMNVGAQMSAIIFADPKDGIVALGSNFITIWARNSSKITKPLGAIANKAWQRDPNTWFKKVGTVPMRIEVTPDEKRENYQVVNVYYNYGKDEGQYAASRAIVKEGRSGFPGFQWGGLRFSVRNLKITAMLDKEAAVEILKSKLGIKDIPGGAPGGGESTKTGSSGAGKKKAGEEEFGF